MPQPLDFDTADRALAGELFETIRQLSAGEAGVTRPSYGANETAALHVIADAAKRSGLRTRTDAAANLIVDRSSTADGVPAVWVGSHLDSVPEGGNYDGLAGVVAALLCMIKAQKDGAPLPLRMLALRGEESAWFGKPYLGSYALMGRLTSQDLDRPHRDSGRPLREYMADAGADVARIAAGQPLIDVETMAAWLELHIEQGPYLQARRLPVGIVTGIRGNIRHINARCIGEAGHSGAVPRSLRHDPVFATAELFSRIDGQWAAAEKEGADLVVTAGVLGTNSREHSVSRIPGDVSFSLEIRSQSMNDLEAMHAFVREQCTEIETARGVRFELGEPVLTLPAELDAAWTNRLRAAAQALELPTMDLASGAGHDAAVFAHAGVPSAMVFVRNDHGSHNPAEHMDLDDFMQATAVLYRAITQAKSAP